MDRGHQRAPRHPKPLDGARGSAAGGACAVVLSDRHSKISAAVEQVLNDFWDDCEQASHNGDLVHAVEAGAITRDDVSQLGDVLIGTAEGRTADGDITIFDSTGLAIQDLAVALAAMEHADELELPTIPL